MEERERGRGVLFFSEFEIMPRHERVMLRHDSVLQPLDLKSILARAKYVLYEPKNTENTKLML